jgi:hypothetical protein
MTKPKSSRMVWYIEHRLEFLENRRESLRAALDEVAANELDPEALREFLEVTGRIRELDNLLAHAELWWRGEDA